MAREDQSSRPTARLVEISVQARSTASSDEEDLAGGDVAAALAVVDDVESDAEVLLVVVTEASVVPSLSAVPGDADGVSSATAICMAGAACITAVDVAGWPGAARKA